MTRTMMRNMCSKSTEVSARNFRHRMLAVAISVVLGLVTAPVVYGQATGSFFGNVLDKSGSAVPGAAVIATAQSTGLARNTTTDNAGHYQLPLLPVGSYTVHVDANGFQSAESRDLRLQGDEARELDFSIVPAIAWILFSVAA